MIRAARRAVPLAVLLSAFALIPTAGATFSGTASNDANSFASAADFNTNPSFRVTTYEAVIADGLDKSILALNGDLSPDYFVLLRGAAGNYTGGTNRGPDADYARIDQDPFGNFAAGSSAPDQLGLSRKGTTGAWAGQVTIVECIADCDNSGFRLQRINEITMNSGVTSASSTSGGSWGGADLGQIALYGGSYGGGMETTETGPANHKTGWARIYPQGGNRVNVTRSNTGSGSITGVTTFTIYVVRWGDEWTIQRARVQGSAGGNGVNDAGEYNTASIATVARANTWVWAAGQVDANSLSAGWEGNVWTLGTGVSTNAAESVVAVGAESGATRDVEVYVHTHSDLGNQYVFGPDGTAPGIVGAGLSGTAAISGALSPETHNSGNTAGRRFILVANSSNGNGTAYPRSIVWGQLDGDTIARWQRSRSGQPGAYWMQTPDFGDIGS